ncbi:MAG: phage tail protein [Opitutales bacterium]
MDRNGFLAAFHFKVEFLDLKGMDIDTRFQSVSGLDASIETDALAEGGENRFKHLLPTGSSYSDLVLKRGMPGASMIIDWCRRAIETLEIHPVDINISLLDPEHQPVMTWQVKHAWPKKWSVADFNAESSAIVIETLEIGYRYFTVTT